MKSYILLIALLLLGVGCTPRRSGPELTAAKASPDGKYLVEIREEIAPLFDRHFKIEIQDQTSGKREVLFLSPDEGAAGTERIIWATNSGHFVIVGRRFSVLTNAPFTYFDVSGIADEYGYFLYDVHTRKIFCNASQSTNLTPFFLSDLQSRGFASEDLPPQARGTYLSPP